MKVSIASDHGGFNLKKYIIDKLNGKYDFIDFGPNNKESVDYPIYATKVAESIKKNECDYGILICTNGVGMTICANKYKGVRAALCLNADMALHAREHNNSNCLCLGEINQSFEEGIEIVNTFLNTEFTDKERHYHRVELIKKIDEKELK